MRELAACRSARWRIAALALLLICGATPQAEAQQALREAEVLDSTLAELRGEVTLPLNWDIVLPARSGRVVMKLRFDLAPAATAQAHVLLIERLGNAYRITVNGAELASGGALDEPRAPWAAKLPVVVNLPAGLLREHNTLRIDLRADGGRHAGLAIPVVGTPAQMRALVVKANWTHVVLPQAAAVWSILVALFCAMLWWQQREALFAWAALAEVFWAIALADGLIEAAVLPWPWWGLVIVTVRAGWALCLYAFAEQVIGPRPRAEFWSMVAVQAATPALVLAAMALDSTLPMRLGNLLKSGLWLVILSGLARDVRSDPRAEKLLTFAALLACVLAALRDGYAARFDAQLYADAACLTYVAPAMGVAVMWIVTKRFRQARHAAARLQATLVEQVQAKEQELQAGFERLAEVERSRATLAERQRILRDMHDGVGASLATAMRQLDSGQVSAAEVSKTLRDSMLQLKLAIDALNLPAGDVNALLASLRFRLQPTLENAGLVLHWQVDALPHWASGNDDAMRHLQYLLLEAVSNVLQHAQASEISVVACSAPDCITISVGDNGRGMGEGVCPRALRERAAAIGAQLRFESSEPGSVVHVILPLVHDS